MRTWIVAVAGVGLAAALAAPNVARAASCAELEAWAAKLGSKQVWNINTIDKRARLYEYFRAPEFDALFGGPALELSDAQVKAASDALHGCAGEARKARRNRESKMLAASQSEFNRRLHPLLGKIRGARDKLEPAMAALEALEPSRPLLRSLDTLRNIGGDADLRPATRLPEGRQLVTLLATLPQEDAVALQPRVAALHAKVHEAVLAEATAAFADAPATPAGVGAVDQTLKRIKYELGPALSDEDAAALDEAAAARRAEIAEALVAEATASLQAVPATVEGASQLPRTVQQIKYQLGQVATPEALAGLEQAAETRRGEIEAVLVDEAKAAVDAGPPGLTGLAALRQVTYQPAMRVLSEPSKQAVTMHAAERRQAIVAEAVAAAEKAPATTDGLAALVKMSREPALGYLTQDERARYNQAILQRRAAIAETLLAEPTAKLAGFGKGLDDLKAMTALRNDTMSKLGPYLAPTDIAPFEQAYRKQRERVAASALPAFQKLISKVPDDDKGIRQIKTALAETGGGLPAFEAAAAKRTRQIQQKLAVAMVDEICGEALKEADLGKSDAKQDLLGMGGNVMTLGGFVCRLKLAGQTFNEYEGAGLFGSESKMKLTTQEGLYLTYTMYEAEVAHGKKALVPFKVADANGEKPLSVDEWQLHLATLMPFDDANPPSTAACERLFEKSDRELRPGDQQRMYACIFSLAQPAE